MSLWIYCEIYDSDTTIKIAKLAAIWKLLQKHLLPTDLTEIQEITADIQKRIQRFVSRK